MSKPSLDFLGRGVKVVTSYESNGSLKRILSNVVLPHLEIPMIIPLIGFVGKEFDICVIN